MHLYYRQKKFFWKFLRRRAQQRRRRSPWKRGARRLRMNSTHEPQTRERIEYLSRTCREKKARRESGLRTSWWVGLALVLKVSARLPGLPCRFLAGSRGSGSVVTPVGKSTEKCCTRHTQLFYSYAAMQLLEQDQQHL